MSNSQVPTRSLPAAVLIVIGLGACVDRPEDTRAAEDAAEERVAELELYVLPEKHHTLDEAARTVADLEPVTFTMASVEPDRTYEGDLAAVVEIGAAETPRFVAWTDQCVGRQIAVAYAGHVLSAPRVAEPLPGELVVTFAGVEPPPATLDETPLAPAWRALRETERDEPCAADLPRVEVRPVLAPEDERGTRFELEAFGPLVLGEPVGLRVTGARRTHDELGYEALNLEVCAADRALLLTEALRSAEGALAVLRRGEILSVFRIDPEGPVPEAVGAFGTEGDIDPELAEELLRDFGEAR